jgi:outer membrane receptor protein involved in Fe transport
VDGFQGGTVEGRAYWKDLNLQFFLHNRDKTLPGGSSATIFGDPRNRFIDTRGMMELRYEPRITDKLQLLARGYGNVYLFRGDYAYDAAAGGVYKDKFDGAWMGGEARLLYTPISQLRVTAGGEYQYHLLTRQVGADDTGEAINRDDPFHVAAGYAVADWQVTPKLKFSGGARVDYYSTFGASVNPRVAAIVRPYDRGNLKILAGKAFRAPSVYELHYVGPNQRAADPLSPEEIWAGEVEFTHRFSNTVTATIAGYANYVTNLVELAGAGTATDPTFYTNSTSNILIPGLEAEVKREWRQGWMLGAQYTFQRAFFPGDATGLREPSNSPLHLASIKGAVPILGRALSLMGRLSVEGPRYDRFERAGDPPQGQTDPFAVFDTVLSGEAEKLGVRYGVGVYNAFDSGYSVPVSSDFRMRRFIQPGRTFYASLSVRF